MIRSLSLIVTCFPLSGSGPVSSSTDPPRPPDDPSGLALDRPAEHNVGVVTELDSLDALQAAQSRYLTQRLAELGHVIVPFTNEPQPGTRPLWPGVLYGLARPRPSEKHGIVFAPLEELGRRMPQEAHLDSVGDAAGMRPDPRLVRVEDDADLTGPIAGFGGGRAAVI